jgi:hypothetical protein
VSAFYVLISYYDAKSPDVDFCVPNPSPTSAYNWGVQQANYALNTLAGARFIGYTGPVFRVIGDVELIEPGTTTCGSGALRNSGTLQDSTGWLCDSVANNRQVVKGFSDRIAQGCGSYCLSVPNCTFCTGIYSSWSHWSSIVDGVNTRTTDVGTDATWMALYTSSQTTLNNDARNWTFYFSSGFISWQYGDDSTCGTSYNNARSMLQTLHSTILIDIFNFDKYTNTDPSWLC